MDTYIGNRIKQKRAMWLKHRKYKSQEVLLGLNLTEGYYMFGGVDQKGNLSNDLWIIQPCIEENEIVFNKSTMDYYSKVKHILGIKLKKVTRFAGKPPCPRIMHGTTIFKDWNKHYLLVIYGGRNDTIYQRTQNVALNDICILNVNRLEWSTLAMYGSLPCSRWSHCFTLNRGATSTPNDGFLVFGGVNLKNYCKSRVYQF